MTFSLCELVDEVVQILAMPQPNFSDWKRDEADVLHFRLTGRGLAGHTLRWQFQVLGAGGYFAMGVVLDEQDVTNPAGKDKHQTTALILKPNASGKKWPGEAYRVNIFVGDVLVKTRGFSVGDR